MLYISFEVNNTVVILGKTNRALLNFNINQYEETKQKLQEPSDSVLNHINDILQGSVQTYYLL